MWGKEMDNIKNPFDGYGMYEFVVSEKVSKNVRVYARDPDSAMDYIQEFLDDIDMEKDIDDYKRTVVYGAESEASDYDYIVPPCLYEE